MGSQITVSNRVYGDRIERDCGNCGAKVYRTPSKILQSKMSFCNVPCRNEYLRKRKQRTIKRVKKAYRAYKKGKTVEILSKEIGLSCELIYKYFGEFKRNKY